MEVTTNNLSITFHLLEPITRLSPNLRINTRINTLHRYINTLHTVTHTAAVTKEYQNSCFPGVSHGIRRPAPVATYNTDKYSAMWSNIIAILGNSRRFVTRARKRARHSQVCSIENRGYNYSMCKFCSYNP